MLVYRMVCSLFFLCDTPIVCTLGAHQSFTNRVGAKIGYSHPRSCSTPRLYSPKNNIFHHNIPTSTMVFECENRYAKSLFFLKTPWFPLKSTIFVVFFSENRSKIPWIYGLPSDFPWISMDFFDLQGCHGIPHSSSQD